MALIVKPVETVLSTSTSATVNITAPGLGTPKAAILWSSGATVKDTSEDHARMSFGFTDGINEFVTCCFDEHNVGTTVSQSRAKEGAVVMHIDGTTVVGEAAFNGWITDGVQLIMTTGFSSSFLVTCLLFADDGTGNVISNVFVGTNNVPAGFVSTVDNTDPGFQPEFIISAHGPQTAYDIHENNAQIGIGLAGRNGSNWDNRGASWFSTHGLDTSSIVANAANSQNLQFLQNSNVERGVLDFIAADSSGFTVRQVDSINAESFDFGYICFAGSAFETNLFVSHYGAATATGDQAQVGVGFQPGCVLQIQSGADVFGAPDITSPLGFSVNSFDSTDEFIQNIVSRDVIGTSDTHSMSKNASILNRNDLISIYNEGNFVSFDADGWTINYTVATNTNQMIGIAFDSEEPVAPADPDTEEPLTISTPANSRDTRLALDTPPAGTTKTQWRITPSNESAFTITTTSSGTNSANVSDSDLTTLNIWLPPSHTYTLETRHFAGSWGAWSAVSTFVSRSPLNSYEKYLALSGISGVDNV